MTTRSLATTAIGLQEIISFPAAAAAAAQPSQPLQRQQDGDENDNENNNDNHHHYENHNCNNTLLYNDNDDDDDDDDDLDKEDRNKKDKENKDEEITIENNNKTNNESSSEQYQSTNPHEPSSSEHRHHHHHHPTNNNNNDHHHHHLLFQQQEEEEEEGVVVVVVNNNNNNNNGAEEEEQTTTTTTEETSKQQQQQQQQHIENLSSPLSSPPSPPLSPTKITKKRRTSLLLQQHNQAEMCSSVRSIMNVSINTGCVSQFSNNNNNNIPKSAQQLPFHQRNIKKKKKNNNKKTILPLAKLSQTVVAVRILFVLFLLGGATLLGFVTYNLTKTQEMTLARAQFTSIADRALQGAFRVVHQRQWTVLTMANIISETWPNATDWPFVYITGYQRIATSLALSGSHLNIGFAPIVAIEQQEEFETFAYDFYENYRYPPLPNTTAIYDDFGKGIWRQGNNNLTSGGKKFHDNNETLHRSRSSNPIIVPIFQIPEAPDRQEEARLFNFYSEPERRKTIDGIRNCAERYNQNVIERNEKNEQQEEEEALLFPWTIPDSSFQDHCNGMTDFVTMVRFNEHRGPSSIMLQPIAPANDPTILTGFVISPFLWDSIFENQFAKDVKKVHGVLKSDTEVHTFTIVNGELYSFEPGDLHEREYDDLGYSIDLTRELKEAEEALEAKNCGTDACYMEKDEEEFHAAEDRDYDNNNHHHHNHTGPRPSFSTNYTLSLYPTRDFFDSYTTNNPRTATIGSILIIFATSFFFFLYDYFVHRAFKERSNLLEAKRRFMRYVSHEVRTPLNAVCMGLNVIQGELKEFIAEGRAKNNQNQKNYCSSCEKKKNALGLLRHDDEDDDGKNSTTLDSPTTASVSTTKTTTTTPTTTTTTAAAEGPSVAEQHKEKRLDPWTSKGLECLDLVEEIQVSALSAVDVLNDVLNYDKIERSMLRLETTMIPTWQFLERTFKEFKLPAAKKELDLKILYGREEQFKEKDFISRGGVAAGVGINKEWDEEMGGGGGGGGSNLHATASAAESVAFSAFMTNISELPNDMQDLLLAADAARMAQVLRNLLSNAIKFTPDYGTITVTSTYVYSQEDRTTIPKSLAYLHHQYQQHQHHRQTKKVKYIELKDGSKCPVEESGYLRVDVKDTGAGLSGEQLETLFGEGVQFNVNTLQAGGGSGLGLFITKGLVEQHGGSLMVSSEGLGQGATFTLWLPLYRDPAKFVLTKYLESTHNVVKGNNKNVSPATMMIRNAAAPGNAVVPLTTATAATTTRAPRRISFLRREQSGLEKLRLLVVDDVLSNRKLLARLLTKKGHNCDMAENGQIAVEMVREAMMSTTDDLDARMYDCILLDFEMPVMNGPMASKEIRETLGSDVFIVGVTGNMLNEDVAYFESQGANVVLPKPVQLPAIEDIWIEYGLISGGTTTTNATERTTQTALSSEGSES